MKRKISAVLFAAVWAFSSVNGISVLCIDAAGTVSVEPSFLSRCVCSDKAAGAESTGGAFHAADKHCRDIPLALTAWATKMQTRFDECAQPSAAAPQFHLPNALPVSVPFASQSPGIGPPAAPLGSILLLI